MKVSPHIHDRCIFLNEPGTGYQPSELEYRLTPWFSGHVRPVRNGVYQRKTDGGLQFYARFEDGLWYWPTFDLFAAKRALKVSLHQHEFKWRGVMK